MAFCQVLLKKMHRPVVAGSLRLRAEMKVWQVPRGVVVETVVNLALVESSCLPAEPGGAMAGMEQQDCLAGR